METVIGIIVTSAFLITITYYFLRFVTGRTEEENRKKVVIGEVIDVWFDTDTKVTLSTRLQTSSVKAERICTLLCLDGTELTLYADILPLEQYMHQTLTVTYRKNRIIAFEPSASE